MAHLRTTYSAMIDGCPTKGFPVIITNGFVIDSPSFRYFLYLLRTCKVDSIKTCASHLLDLICQLEVDQRGLDSIDEAWLAAYKNAIVKRFNSRGRRNSENYACQVLRSVVAYCHWFENQGYARLLCGATDAHSIQIIERADGSLSHPLFKNKSTDKRSARAPRSEWIEQIKSHARVTDDASLKSDLRKV